MFARSIPIRWRDIDALGHVNNAVYLTYLEELLTQGLEPVLGIEWVLVRAELNFGCELVLDDAEVRAEGRLEGLGTSSFTLGVSLSRTDGVVAADGRMVLAAWAPEARQSRPLSLVEREALQELE